MSIAFKLFVTGTLFLFISGVIIGSFHDTDSYTVKGITLLLFYGSLALMVIGALLGIWL